MTYSVFDGNRRLAQGAAAFIAAAEHNYNQQLEEIADYIAAHRDTCPIVLISGPSGSGKTTTALILESKLDSRGLQTHTLSQDNYFNTQTAEDQALLEQGKFDLESPERVDANLLNSQLQDLIDGKTIQLTEFDFRTGVRHDSGKTLTRREGEIVILEGIHTLNPDVVRLPETQTVRLYVSVRTRVEGPDGWVMHPKYVRVLRRMLRDVKGRGRHAEDTLRMCHSVNVGEDNFIMPFKHRSTFDVDTFFDYELHVYRTYLLDTLRKLTNYSEVAKILPVLSAADGLDADGVPSTALIREFIGDSVYHQ